MRDPRPYVRESRDVTALPSAFRSRVDEVLAAMAAKGHDAFVFEALRTKERQWWIFGCGRSEAECRARLVPESYAFPGGKRVTNAPSHLVSVHGHGLAVDIISKSKLWSVSEAFKSDLAAAAAAARLTWGGLWHDPVDWPHLQWPLQRSGRIYAGPSASDRDRTAAHGMRATWAVYGADVAPDPQTRIAA